MVMGCFCMHRVGRMRCACFVLTAARVMCVVCSKSVRCDLCAPYTRADLPRGTGSVLALLVLGVCWDRPRARELLDSPPFSIVRAPQTPACRAGGAATSPTLDLSSK